MFFLKNRYFIKNILRLVKNFLLGVEENRFGPCTVYFAKLFHSHLGGNPSYTKNDNNLKFAYEKNCFADILEKMTCVLIEIYIIISKKNQINSI